MHDNDVLDAVTLMCLRPPSDTREARVVKECCHGAGLGREGLAGPVPPAWADRIAAELTIMPGERASRIAHARARAERALADAARAGLIAVTWRDSRYPALLWELPDPPIVLWIKGQWEVLHLPSVAIVGARNATPTGAHVAREIAEGLARAGLAVVSGLARGIDAAAHRGALDAGGQTAAVLGCGADVVYPADHDELAGLVTSAGAIVSEFLPGSRPLAHHFPLRNRIVSGLARAVVVVEASDRSGSLITARLALEQGRDVLAVPGSVLSGGNTGCHRLIKDGARLVETVKDVLDELGWAPDTAVPRPGADNPSRMSGLEERMATGESYNLDQLAADDPGSAADVLAELTKLELAGRVRRLPGGHFVRMGS